MKKSMEFAKQKMFQRNNKGQRGITLIALVITIIVLLILAGVTIAMLSGDNSAPQKATEAAQKDAIAGAKDEIAMEVQEALLNYYNNTYVKGNVTEGASTQSVVTDAAYDAVENAKKRNSQLLSSSTVDKKEYKITLETKSYTVTGKIEEKGGISWSDAVVSTGGTGGEKTKDLEKAKEINKKIGQDVDYSGYSSSYSGGWRVFYASDEELFLIATSTQIYRGIPKGDYNSPDDVFSPKNPGSGSFCTYKNVTYGAKYNLHWKEKLDSASSCDFTFGSTAYLCDPRNWERYISKDAPTGTYAVGGATLELFVMSWNKARESGLDNAPNSTITWDDSDVDEEGYLFGRPIIPGSGYQIKNSILPKTPGGDDGLYNPKNGFYSYWLASPCLHGYNHYVCSVLSSGCLYGNSSSDGYNNNYNVGIRPIVSIPISNVQIGESEKVTIVP